MTSPERWHLAGLDPRTTQSRKSLTGRWFPGISAPPPAMLTSSTPTARSANCQESSLAQKIGATAVWRQSGLASAGTGDSKGCWVAGSESRQARQIVESAGLDYLEQPYIADAARRITGEAGRADDLRRQHRQQTCEP